MVAIIRNEYKVAKLNSHHMKDAQASGCCSQALGKFLLTFPARSAFL